MINITVNDVDIYCPSCAAIPVYYLDDGGDYYEGDLYYCVTCYTKFTMPSLDTDGLKAYSKYDLDCLGKIFKCILIKNQ